MRKFVLKKGSFRLQTEVKLFYEKQITRFGNGAKIDAPKKYRGKRAYVIIVKD